MQHGCYLVHGTEEQAAVSTAVGSSAEPPAVGTGGADRLDDAGGSICVKNWVEGCASNANGVSKVSLWI